MAAPLFTVYFGLLATWAVVTGELPSVTVMSLTLVLVLGGVLVARASERSK